jgi:hypothetical protein
MERSSTGSYNRRQKIMFFVQSTTEMTVGHLEVAVIATKQETPTGQVKRQGSHSA